jgi:hypothetical protein
MNTHVLWPPGLWWGAAGGLAYALAAFLVLADPQENLLDRQHRRLYLVQVATRAILGAIVGAATLTLGANGAAFVSGLAGPAALVALGARFDRRKAHPSGKEAAPGAADRPNTKRQT